LNHPKLLHLLTDLYFDQHQTGPGNDLQQISITSRIYFARHKTRHGGDSQKSIEHDQKRSCAPSDLLLETAPHTERV
jgi:hypothetical protein